MEIQEKTINLVFDNWENGNELPNGANNFKNFHFFNATGLFSTHVCDLEHRKINDNRRIKIKKHELTDVIDNNSKYFYVVSSPLLEFQNLNNEDLVNNNSKSFFSKEVLKVFKNNLNFYLFFTREHEPASDYEIKCFLNFCHKFEIDSNRIFYINNNSNSYELSKKYNINLKKINFIEYSSTKILTKIDDVKFQSEKKGKFFMCRNSTPKPHRINLLFHLEKNNILNNTNYSLLKPLDINDTDSYKFTLSDEEIENNKDIIKKLSIFKEDDVEVLYGYYDKKNEKWTHPSNNFMQYPELKEIYENSFVNIVTESNFFDNSIIHITEKSFRPFYYYQIPLILSSTHHYKKLKEKYNFDFFEDIIDLSFDSEYDNKKRFILFVEEIKKLNNKQNNIKEFYKNNQHRFKLNRKKLLDIALDKTGDFDLFWNLL